MRRRSRRRARLGIDARRPEPVADRREDPDATPFATFRSSAGRGGQPRRRLHTRAPGGRDQCARLGSRHSALTTPRDGVRWADHEQRGPVWFAEELNEVGKALRLGRVEHRRQGCLQRVDTRSKTAGRVARPFRLRGYRRRRAGRLGSRRRTRSPRVPDRPSNGKVRRCDSPAVRARWHSRRPMAQCG